MASSAIASMCPFLRKLGGGAVSASSAALLATKCPHMMASAVSPVDVLARLDGAASVTTGSTLLANPCGGACMCGGRAADYVQGVCVAAYPGVVTVCCESDNGRVATLRTRAHRMRDNVRRRAAPPASAPAPAAAACNLPNRAPRELSDDSKAVFGEGCACRALRAQWRCGAVQQCR